jgi:hypothetical protein
MIFSKNFKTQMAQITPKHHNLKKNKCKEASNEEKNRK